MSSRPDWSHAARTICAHRPRHVLFLCVANSARSQMAEGIARLLAPEGVRVSSAGSEPSRIHPYAMRSLEEIGIDASGQRSKGMDEIQGPVDAVITLCAEEVCPAWLGDTVRAYWPLPDPADVTGSEEEILGAFRSVRDELRMRLEVLFGSGSAMAHDVRVHADRPYLGEGDEDADRHQRGAGVEEIEHGHRDDGQRRAHGQRADN